MAGTTYKFEAEYKGYKVFAKLDGWGREKTVFGADVLESKTYETAEAMEKAVDAFDLKARKGFKNPVAWCSHGSWRYRSTDDGPVEVTVTSLDDTQSEAWIKYKDGTREKKSIKYLFESKEAVMFYEAAVKTANARHETVIKQIDANRGAWKPVAK